MLHKALKDIFPDPPAGLDPVALDVSRVPEHVAIIMDGNGRWAKQRAMNRLRGHRAGIDAVRESIRCASDVGVRYLTLYSFSTENWKRPQEEVVGLMSLFAKTMTAEIAGLDENDVRVMTIGDTSILPDETRRAFEDAMSETAGNTGMTLLVALNYGGRAEILRGVQSLVDEALARGSALSVDERIFGQRLYTRDIPDPELVIRTSGESRISNFLLWQIAYSEFYVTDVLWPDFNRYDFLRALLDYQRRTRRFGGV